MFNAVQLSLMAIQPQLVVWLKKLSDSEQIILSIQIHIRMCKHWQTTHIFQGEMSLFW